MSTHRSSLAIINERCRAPSPTKMKRDPSICANGALASSLAQATHKLKSQTKKSWEKRRAIDAALSSKPD